MANELATAYLTLVPSLKGSKKAIERELGGIDTSGAGRDMGDKLGAGFGDTFKKTIRTIAGAWMVKEFAQGFANVTKAALDSFSNYQQLEGGVEKIFDEMDNSKIFADASRAYKELNMSANEYLEVINQTGAAFAATMGDEAGYNAARQGLMAISDYASGTGRSISELSEKFTLITRSTSSYQSIADQFSGILPQTSADFLEQAQAAGFLSEQYTSLTQVPIEDYQQAVTLMLEQGVEAMGLAGNTLAETTETVSGSLAALKASWSDWLTAIASDEMDVDLYTGNLVTSLKNAARNVVPRIGQIASTLLPALSDAVGQIVDEIMVKFSENGVGIGEAALEFFGSILSAMAQLAPKILAAFGVFLASLVVALVNKGAEMLSSAGAVAGGIVSEIARGLDEGIQRVKAKVGGFVQAGKDIVAGIVSGITSAAGAVWDAIVRICSNSLDAIKDFFGIASPSKVMREMFGYVGEGMALGLNDKAARVVGAMQGIATSTASAASFSATPHLAVAGAGVGGVTYNVYINGAQVNSDSAIEGCFYNFMTELQRLGVMQGGN